MNHQIKILGSSIPTSPYGTPYFWFDSLSGFEKINDLFEYQLVVKVRDEFLKPAHGYKGLDGYVSKQQADAGGSPATHLDLQKLIGTEVAIQIRLDGVMVDLKSLGGITTDADNNYQSNISGTRFYRGLVTRVEALAVKNRHAMYKITLVPWVWLLNKTTDYKIYQNKNVLQIIEEVLLDYPYPVDYRCTQDYPVLDFQVQYGESDYDFIVRLMQEHGINFHFEHSKSHLTFVLSDHNAAYQPMQAKAYQKLDIYPPNQRFPIQAEYIEHFEPAQQLVSGKVKLSDYQFKQPSLVQTANEQFLWDHQHAEHEVYEWQQGDFLDSSSGQTKAKTISESLYQHGYRALGKARLKGLQTGFRFSLDNHPNTESNKDWIVLGTQTTIQDISEEKSDNQFYDSTVEFMVQSVDQILRPDRTYAKPNGRPQTATVVGPSGEEIHTDQYGRVKVQFHWDHYGAKDENSTCWLRVSTAWAGNNFGTVHLPRIGQEVIVDFFNADPDMPFVAGRLTNPEQMPVWELPSQKALSGIKSKELGGSQSNQLVMDDTNGQVQVHLKSDHQSSELNLGYITRIPDPSGRSDYRGEGFELRTDGHGVVRAGKGLILTTFAKLNSESYIKKIDELIRQLKNAVKIHESLVKLAIVHKAEPRSKDEMPQIQLVEELEQIEGGGKEEFPELSNPHIVMGSANGISLSSQSSTHISSNEHIALTAKKDLSLTSENNLFASVSKGISLFAQNLGARLFAAKGKVEIQAQSDDLDLIADHNVKILSLKKKNRIGRS